MTYYDLGTYKRPITTSSPEAQLWFDRGLNNAHLASIATYFGCVPGFERLLAASGHDLPRFYAAVRELAAQPPAQRKTALCGSAGTPAEPPADASLSAAE